MVTASRQSALPAEGAAGAAGRRSSYSRRPAWRTGFFRLLLVAPSAALAGCGLLAPGLDGTVTGSIASIPVAVPARAPTPQGVTPEDWIAARRALAEALAARDAAPSVPWENAATATRGTVTPVAANGDGQCRTFLVSFVRAGAEDWLQGEACRTAASGWQVDQARLLARS